MKNLNSRISQQMARYTKRSSISVEALRRLNIQKMQLYSDFQIWLENLKNSMRICKYRQVIGEIEAKKTNFKSLEELHWKYQYIEIDAIFKIVKKKFLSHKKDISIENSHQYHSCLFWLNQIFILLEQLILGIRPDLNKKFNFNDEDMMKPVQCAIDGYIKLCFLLLIFAQYNQQLPDILSYLSIIDRIVPYMNYTSKSSTYICLQKIMLFKVKILAENCDYLNAVDCLESNIKFCFEYIRLFSDEDFNVYVFDLNNEKYKKYLDNINKSRVFKNNRYMDLINQNRDKNNDNLNKSDKMTLITLSDKNLKNFPNINDIMKKNKKKILKEKKNKNLKEKKLKNLEEKKITTSLSNMTNITNSTNNNIKEIKKNDSPIKTPSQKKVLKLKSTKNITKPIIVEENKKRDLFLIKKKTLKPMEKSKKRVIEEILSNMALNFYLRGAIFEHVGNIDSALDSYKEVDWFCLKFLGNKFPYFVKYMSNLLNCAWNNYNTIYKLKYEKEKSLQKGEILKKIQEMKRREKIRAQERHNEEMLRFKSSKLYHNKKLNTFLNKLGDKIYKEEEQRNFNIYSKFTKTGYILSTYKMIDNLLSDDFRNILQHMKNVDVTKQGEEIKDLIDRALIKKQHQSSISKDNSSTINNIGNATTINYMNNNFNNINNTKTSSIIMKESSTNNNQKSEINTFTRVGHNLLGLKKQNKRGNDKIIPHYIENSSRKYSTSCEISYKNFKKSNTLYSYNDRSIKSPKISINRTKIDNGLSKNLFGIKANTNYSQTPKLHSAIFRSSNKRKVPKYVVDKKNFNRGLIRKKTFLDRYSTKEFTFLKNLLETKSVFPEIVRPIDDLDIKKVKQDADLNFSMKLEIAKSGRNKKNLTNLIKQNINVVASAKNKNLNRSDTPTEQSGNNNIEEDNKQKLKQIEDDYINIITKRNRLIKGKKGINHAF